MSEGCDDLVLRTMEVTQNMLRQHEASGQERSHLMDKRIDDMNSRLEAIVTLIDKYMETHNHILNAFPGGDLVGHKEAHDAWIRETERKAEFWRTMKLELAKWGLIGFLGWVFVQLWTGALKGPQ